MADKPIMTDVNINGRTEKFADPQHFTGSNNEGRARTGEKNPFPTKDDKVLAKLNEIDNRLSKIESGDITLNTQLTGSNVEDRESVPVKKRKLEWYASDGFNINVEPGGTYLFQDSDFLNYADNFKNLSEYEYYYIGVQTESIHDFKVLRGLNF